MVVAEILAGTGLQEALDTGAVRDAGRHEERRDTGLRADIHVRALLDEEIDEFRSFQLISCASTANTPL